jgi:hypothetical protein
MEMTRKELKTIKDAQKPVFQNKMLDLTGTLNATFTIIMQKQLDEESGIVLAYRKLSGAYKDIKIEYTTWKCYLNDKGAVNTGFCYGHYRIDPVDACNDFIKRT